MTESKIAMNEHFGIGALRAVAVIALLCVVTKVWASDDGGMTKEEVKAALAFVPCKRDVETRKVISCPDTSKDRAISKEELDNDLRKMVPKRRKLPW